MGPFSGWSKHIGGYFFHWRYNPLWALVCGTITFQFFSIYHQLSPSSHSQHLEYLFLPSSVHPFLGLPLRLVPSSSWVKIFLGILSSSILSRWPSQLILCPFIHFTIISPLLNYRWLLCNKRSGAVAWSTALQDGRSQVRFPMVSLEFFIDIILPAALWPWGRLSL